MRIYSITTWMATLALALTAMSCSKSNTQTVTITFPDWKQLQAATYQRQSQFSSPTTSADEFENVGILSVTVNGQPTRYTANGVQGVFPWSQDSRRPVPKSVTFQADKGALVQAIAIIENQGARQFFYGDAAVGSGDTQTLDLYMSNAFTTGIAEGNLIGRYITKTDGAGAPSGPTGTFQYRFQPPGGKPSMVVTTSEMFSGWMNITTFGSNVLTFTWPDGTPVFAQGVQADDRLVDAATPKRIARIRIPESYSPKDGRIEHRGANLLTVGYFGPAVETAASGGALRVCMTSPVAGVNVPVANFFSDSALSDQFYWVGRGSVSLSDAYHRVSVLKNSNGVFGGAENSTPDYCQSGGSEYANFINIDPDNFSSNDEIIGVKGPFIRDASRNFVTTNYDNVSNQVEVNWKLAPNAGVDLDGFSVFFREKPANSSEDDLRTMDGYACNAFRSGEIPGFRETKVGVGTTATLANVTMTQYANSQIVVCPRAKDGTLYKAGVMESSGSGGYGGVQATKLQILAADGVETTSANPKSVAPGGVCFPITIRATDAAGTIGSLSSTTTLTLTPSANVALHKDPNCVDTAMSSMTAPNFNGGSYRVFVRSLDGTDHDFQINVGATPDMAQFAAVYFGRQLSALPAGVLSKIKVLIPPTIHAYSCEPIEYTLIDANSGAIIGSPSDTNLWFPSLANVAYFAADDVGCMGSPITGTQLMNGVSNNVAARVMYSYTTPVSYDFAANISGADGIATNVSIVQPGPAVRLNVLTPNVYQAGICTSIRIQLLDADGRPAPASANVLGTLSASVPGTFSDCMTIGGGATTAGFSVSTGQTVAGQSIGFTPDVSATGVFSFSITGVSGLATNVFPINVTPAPAFRLVLLAPGETWNPSLNVVQGTPSLLLAPLATFQVDVLVITQDGRIANGTNGTESYNNGSLILTADGASGAYTFANGGLSQSVTMTNGMGSFSLLATSGLPVSGTIAPYFSVSDGILLSNASMSGIPTAP